MRYTLLFTDAALADIAKHRRSGNKKILKRLERLLQELIVDPRNGAGQPKQLKHDLKGFYSRRIDIHHRLVYQISETTITVLVLSAHGHYDD